MCLTYEQLAAQRATIFLRSAIVELLGAHVNAERTKLSVEGSLAVGATRDTCHAHQHQEEKHVSKDTILTVVSAL